MSKLSKWIDSNITHKTSRKHQEQALKSQLEMYTAQVGEAHAERDKIKADQAEEKRRVNEKSIRSMRRQFRSSGFLDEPVGGGSGDGIKPTLG